MKKTQGGFQDHWLATLVALTLVLSLASGVVRAQDPDTVRMAYRWSAPTCGTPVHHYVLQIEKNGIGGEPSEPIFSLADTLTLVKGNKYRVRVAAVDADGHQGAWSGWSAYFSPTLGPPGF